MRRLIRWLRPSVAWLLLAHLILVWGVVLAHTHTDGGFHQTCPACHQERVVSAQPAVIHCAVCQPALVFQGLTSTGRATTHRLDPVLAGRSPRGPPLPR